MAPRMKKDEVNAVDKVMENLGTNGVDDKLKEQIREDIVEVYAETRTHIRRNVRKIILESMGFDTRYRHGHLGFYGTFDRRNTDVCNQLQNVAAPLISELATDLDSRIIGKVEFTEAQREQIANDMAESYKQAFYQAVQKHKSAMREKAEKDFEKLMPFILGSATGATGDELHAEYIMSVIAGDAQDDPEIVIDQDIIDKCVTEEHWDDGR